MVERDCREEDSEVKGGGDRGDESKYAKMPVSFERHVAYLIDTRTLGLHILGYEFGINLLTREMQREQGSARLMNYVCKINSEYKRHAASRQMFHLKKPENEAAR